MPEPVMLQIENISKSFNTRGKQHLALDNISLELYEGEILALVGESGSGKTTLGRIIAGLEQASTGTVFYQGEALPQRYSRRDFAKNARRIQMVFQDPLSSLNPQMTIGEIISEPLVLGRKVLNRKQQLTLAGQWLERVGLGEHFLQRYPFELSGGQRQRVGIARALINEPRILICDEPVSALDVSVQAQIINLLISLQQTLGISILFIAHDLSVVEYVSDRTAVLYHGELLEIGETRRVFEQPEHPYTRDLLHAHQTLRQDINR